MLPKWKNMYCSEVAATPILCDSFVELGVTKKHGSDEGKGLPRSLCCADCVEFRNAMKAILRLLRAQAKSAVGQYLSTRLLYCYISAALPS